MSSVVTPSACSGSTIPNKLDPSQKEGSSHDRVVSALLPARLAPAFEAPKAPVRYTHRAAPSGRGSAEVARKVVSNQACHVTGGLLPVDGGCEAP
jgi:hypothetical protein